MKKVERKSLQAYPKKNKPPTNPWVTALQVLICILVAGLTIYTYIDKQNELTELRLAIPALAKEVKQIQEENIRLRYEIDQFESPIHLMELARKPEFGHLKYPHLDDEIILQEKVISAER